MPLTDDVLSRHEVRLFPSVRISSDREAELRATAALLSIVKGVSEFGRAVVSMAGGPGGQLECYTEPPFAVETPEKRRELRPDGLFRVRRGERDWKALVEVKVGDNVLDQEQFDGYHQLAKPEGIDALITSSNQAALSNGLARDCNWLEADGFWRSLALRITHVGPADRLTHDLPRTLARRPA